MQNANFKCPTFNFQLLICLFLTIYCLLLTAYFSLCNAQDGETIINADLLEYDKEREVYYLRGNVRFEDKNMKAEADTAEINTRSKEGILNNAHILFKKDNYHIIGDRVEKVNGDNYVLRKGSFTTCDTLLPAWCFYARRADIQIGDKIEAKDVTFKIKGIPVFYSPYIWVPIQNERKTGFLFPGIGFYSDKGIHYRQPFYLVLSQNRDATFYYDFYSKIGSGEAVEYQYIEKSIGEGRLWAYHLKDRDSDKDFYEFKVRDSFIREGALSGFLNINAITENTFYQKYSNNLEVRATKFLESTGSIYYPFNNGRVYIQGWAWQDLDDPNLEITQKVPEIGLSYYPYQKGPFYISMDTSYSYFYSKDTSRVHRLDIYPKIYHSAGDSVQLSQSIGLRETLYNFSGLDDIYHNTSRESFDYTIRLHSRLIKKYPSIKHIIEPEILYTFIPEWKETLPVIDSTEFYNKVSSLEIAIKSYLIDHNGIFLTMRLSGVHDFHDADSHFSLLKYESYLSRPLSLTMDASIDPDKGHFETFNYATSFSIYKTKISIGQRYNRKEEIETYTGSIEIPVTKRFNLTTSAWYDRAEDIIRQQTIQSTYSAQCWKLSVQYIKRPDEYSLFLIIELKGLGSLSLISI